MIPINPVRTFRGEQYPTKECLEDLIQTDDLVVYFAFCFSSL